MLVGIQTGAATVENSMEAPQKIKNRTTPSKEDKRRELPYDPSVPLLGIYQKKSETLI